MRCVNIELPSFKELAKETDLHTSELEYIVHQYQEENNTDAYPS